MVPTGCSGQPCGIELGSQRAFVCFHSALPWQTIYDIRDDWEHPTMKIEDTWRFIPIAGGWHGVTPW